MCDVTMSDGVAHTPLLYFTQSQRLVVSRPLTDSFHVGHLCGLVSEITTDDANEYSWASSEWSVPAKARFITLLCLKQVIFKRYNRRRLKRGTWYNLVCQWNASSSLGSKIMFRGNLVNRPSQHTSFVLIRQSEQRFLLITQLFVGITLN